MTIIETEESKALDVEKIIHIVKDTDSLVKRVRWTNEQIGQFFGKRSSERVIAEGHTCYMNPCLDLSLVALHKFNEGGLPATLLVEEVEDPRYPCGVPHFAIQSAGGYVDFAGMGKVCLGLGEYRFSKPRIKSTMILRIPASEIGVADSIKEVLEKADPRGEKIFRDYSLEWHMNQLAKDNTDAVYQNYLRLLGGNLGLRLVRRDLPGNHKP